jgi:threonine/homoserine/homoserine lactone efflux protein
MTAIVPLFVFAVLSCGTPGPNTLVLASCGANFGFRGSLPYSAGIVVGRAVLQLLVILVLGMLFASSPAFHGVLRVLGTGYLLYLSYAIATARPVDRAADRPLTFRHAALYQFVNPKVWANTTTALAVFDPAMVVVMFAVVSTICNSVWALFGVQIGKLLRSPGSLRAFNVAMGTLNAACIVLIWV